MNLENAHVAYTRRNRSNVSRPPMWLMSDLAARVGVKTMELNIYLREAGAPKAELNAGCDRRGYYNLSKFDTWWKARKQQ